MSCDRDTLLITPSREDSNTNTTPCAAGLVAADEQDVADDLGGTQSTHAVGCKFQQEATREVLGSY